MKNKITKLNTGFTLIETMISVSLFIVIVMAGMTALLNANLLQQKSAEMRSILDNLSFIMDDMSTNLRTGYDYHCITDSNGGLNADLTVALSGNNCSGIAFEYQNGDPTISSDQWVYFIDASHHIWKSTQGPYNVFPSHYVQLTPDNVAINSASSFIITEGSSLQPFVTIKLVGTITTSQGVTTPFSLQTSVSQRKLNYE